MSTFKESVSVLHETMSDFLSEYLEATNNEFTETAHTIAHQSLNYFHRSDLTDGTKLAIGLLIALAFTGVWKDMPDITLD